MPANPQIQSAGAVAEGGGKVKGFPMLQGKAGLRRLWFDLRTDLWQTTPIFKGGPL
jgi:hypothetical protein